MVFHQYTAAIKATLSNDHKPHPNFIRHHGQSQKIF